MNAHSFHPTVLREYDVRGTYGVTLTEQDARALGAAFGSRVKQEGGKHVAIGRDGRVRSPGISERFSDGVRSRKVH